MTALPPWVVVGLGNPGARYKGTRHNIGASVVLRMAELDGQRLRQIKRTQCDVADGRIGDQRLVWAVPHSYMNESGGPVSALTAYFSVPGDRLVVVHDEIDLPFGVLRLKFGGGDNGHNGLKSIRKSLGSGEWYRVRVGIGRGRADAVDHVLSGFNGSERKQLPELIDHAGAAVEHLIRDGLSSAQNSFNS